MTYIYCADTYCDECGRAIAQDIVDSGQGPADIDDERSYDSDEFPKGPYPSEETDGPDHCANDDCLGDVVDLGDYGLEPGAELFGAERRVIGELLSDGLTEHGVSYLRELLDDSRKLTPYQVALHRFWRDAFADELGQEDESEQDRPEDSDGYVNEPAYGCCVVSLDGRMIGEADGPEEAFVLLARAMRATSYWPNVWYVNERGNMEQVSLDVETGGYTFTGNGYV